MSLTELLVTMFIATVVLSGTMTLVVGLQRTNAQNVSRTDQVDAARSAVERVIKTLRTSVMQSQLGATGSTADAFIQGEDYGVQFYGNLNNTGNTVGPSKVTYRIVATGAGLGELHETVQKPDSPIPSPAHGYEYTNTANIVDTVVARDVLTSTGTAIFAYYDGSSTTPLPMAGGVLTSDQLGKVLAIEVTITVQAQTAQKALPTTYMQRIMLPNAEAVIRQGEENTP
jgi:hypothetical protein